MDLKLIRQAYRSDGIFSCLENEGGEVIAYTLEHAYPVQDGQVTEFLPKILPGEYLCVRGNHQLHSMKHPFETFEVTGVPGHSGILFHVGNFNRDSDGCILLGGSIMDWPSNGQALARSNDAFNHFMVIQQGVQSFKLTVIK